LTPKKRPGPPLQTAIHWGRYAEFFGFEDDTDELFLETSEPVSS
jgi:hypothetical protein